jgi:hypothetical protein
MLLDQVSETQMQAGRIMAGATMAAFLAAPLFRRQARTIQLVVGTVYIGGMLGLLMYFLL